VKSDSTCDRLKTHTYKTENICATSICG